MVSNEVNEARPLMRRFQQEPLANGLIYSIFILPKVNALFLTGTSMKAQPVGAAQNTQV